MPGYRPSSFAGKPVLPQ